MKKFRRLVLTELLLQKGSFQLYLKCLNKETKNYFVVSVTFTVLHVWH